MDIITFVLTENDARLIGQQGLDVLAVLDTPQVMVEVRRYIADPQADQQIVDMVKRAYVRPLWLLDVTSDAELMAAVKLIEASRPLDITAEVPQETLLEYKRAIDKFMECSFAVPYKSPVKTASFEEVETILMGIDAGVYHKIKKAKKLFIDSHNSHSVGTAFKRCFYNIDNLNIIKYGIDFMLESSKHYSPVAWRHL